MGWVGSVGDGSVAVGSSGDGTGVLETAVFNTSGNVSLSTVSTGAFGPSLEGHNRIMVKIRSKITAVTIVTIAQVGGHKLVG